MAEVSKTTADRLAHSSAVVAAIEVQGATIAEKAQEALFEKKKAPALASFVEQLGKVLRVAEDDLRAKDASYLAELTNDEGVRSERDAADAALRELLIGARSIIVGAYGSAFAASVGLGTNIERRPDLLVAQSRNVGQLLTTKKAPASKVGKTKIKLSDIASSLEAGASELERKLAAVERDRREAQTAMVARDQATERWERVYGAVAEILVGLAFVAGEDELAARIKPTARRRAGIPDVTEPAEPPADDVEPPTDEPVAPPAEG